MIDFEGVLDPLEEVQEEVDLGRTMLRNYVKWALDEDDEWWDEVVATEVEFNVPIYTPKGNKARGTFAGRFDLLVKDFVGHYWIVEHKTASQISTDHLELDEQVVGYIYGAQETFDVAVEGVIYNILRKKDYTTHTVNQDGSISKRKVVSTAKRLRNRLIDHYGGEDQVPWDEYQDMIEHYEQKQEAEGHPLFERVRVRKTQQEVENFKERLYCIYRDMRGDPRIYPNPTRDCSWDCSFEQPCVLKNAGGDYESYLEENYSTRDEEVA